LFIILELLNPVAVVRRRPFLARTHRERPQSLEHEAIPPSPRLGKTWRAKGAPVFTRDAPITDDVHGADRQHLRANGDNPRANRAPGFPQGARHHN
jgi:hypothetical protein